VYRHEPHAFVQGPGRGVERIGPASPDGDHLNISCCHVVEGVVAQRLWVFTPMTASAMSASMAIAAVPSSRCGQRTAPAWKGPPDGISVMGHAPGADRLLIRPAGEPGRCRQPRRQVNRKARQRRPDVRRASPDHQHRSWQQPRPSRWLKLSQMCDTWSRKCWQRSADAGLDATHRRGVCVAELGSRDIVCLGPGWLYQWPHRGTGPF
jgi:hypothetical protein